MGRTPLLNSEEAKLLVQDYQSGLSQERAGQRYGISHSSVHRYLKRAGVQARVPGPPNQPSRGTIDAMCLEYQDGLSAVQVGLRHNLSGSAVINRLRREGVLIRPAQGYLLYQCNEHYFDVLDTSEKAYWVGFLAADGCVNDVYKTLLLALTLKIADKSHIEKFRDCLKSNRRIYTDSRVATLHIRNNHICKALAQYGVIPRKSLVLEFPHNIPESLMSHYMRGFIDGDGCWSGHPDKSNYALSVCSGSRKFLVEFRKTLMQHCNLSKAKIYTHVAHGRSYHFGYGGRLQVAKIANFIYRDATMYLDRKWNINKSALTPQQE